MNIGEIIVALPKYLDHNAINELLINKNIQMCLNNRKMEGKIIFDFRECVEISPTSIIFVKILRDICYSAGLKTLYRKSKNDSTQNFMQRMNLLPRSKNYIDTSEMSDIHTYPLHLCDNTEQSEAAHKDIINKLKSDFANMDKDTVAAIDYMLTEIRDNAGVHGYEAYHTNLYKLPVYICSSENKDSIEISVGDLGQGVYKSLTKNNKNVEKLNCKKVVLESFKNKVSGHPDSSPGFGLYSAIELLRDGSGELHMWTSNCYVKLEHGREKIYTCPYPIGTIITFIIDKSSLIPFDDLFFRHGLNKNSCMHIEDFMEGIFDD